MDTILSVAERRAPVGNGASSRVEAENKGRDKPTHLRPRILRRETSQILSYYQSADAGRSDSDSYACAYRSASPGADSLDASQDAHIYDRSGSCTESRSTSPLSTYSSDYDMPYREHIGNRNITDGNAERNGDGDNITMQNYGIALGKSGGGTLSTSGMTTSAPTSGTGTDAGVVRDCTDVDSGYGSRITAQLDSGRCPSPAQPSLHFQLSLPQSKQSWPERGQIQAQTASAAASVPTSGAPGVSAPATATVDPVVDPGIEPDVAPGRRRRISSRGAADKRRVAIVQVDSETDVSERERELEEGHAREGEYLNRGLGTLSDGYGRVEANRIGQGQQQTHAQFSASGQSPSSSNSHPPSAFYSHSAAPSTKSTGGSALLLRRGINGTFALVAPPDASPSAYANLSYFTPPLSAPVSAHPTPPLLTRHESAESSTTTNTSVSSSRLHHQRSQSEAILTGARGAGIHSSVNVNAYSTGPSRERRRPGGHLRKGSRDIGIVGTNTAISPTSEETMRTDEQMHSEEAKGRTVEALDKISAHPGQLSPIFQTPSLSQTPFMSSGSASSARAKEPQMQRTSTSEDKKRRSPQHSSNSSNTASSNTPTSNSTESRSPREEKHTIPAGVGTDLKQIQHAPSLSSATYPSLSGSSTASSPHHHILSTSPPSSVSSLHTVGMTAPAPAPSPYLHYQPGVHATAGPLPSPPRQIIPPECGSPPPPRPPRLHAPSSGASSLAKRKSDTSINFKQDPTQMQEKESSPPANAGSPRFSAPVMTPSTTSSTLVNSQSEDSVKSKGHTREGAFPITSVIVTDAAPAQLPTVKQEQQERQALERKDTVDKLVKDVTAAIDETAVAPFDSSISISKRSDPQPPVVHKEASKDHEMHRSRSGMDLSREESRAPFKRAEKPPRSPSSIYSDGEYENIADITITKPLPEPVFTSPPSSPRIEPHEVNNTVSKPQKIIDYALKRFSTLPRPPSRLSATRASPRSSTSREPHSHSPSERSDQGHAHAVVSPRKRIVNVPKIKSPWPDAMSFGDVLAKKSPLERSLAYARKINELANHDPGLGDWVVSTKHNLVSSNKGSKRKSASPVAVKSPSERSFTFQPRHPSRGSIGSEMTFPKRVDAYVATDLQRTPEDQKLPQGPPPTLPYPTLAHGPPPQQHNQQAPRLGGSSSVRSNQSSVGTGKPSGGGFFASIGRKASVKKDRPVLQNIQPNKLLSKRQQAAAAIPPAPRPVQISASPSLPGGPRAPPGRVQRAQSVIAPRVTGLGSAAAESEPDVGRRRSIKRSPSVAPLPRSGSNTGNGAPTDIEVKVGKLADLLPHADRKILAGYLQRAGGMDMVAIGRYLDDEKNGTLIRD